MVKYSAFKFKVLVSDPKHLEGHMILFCLHHLLNQANVGTWRGTAGQKWSWVQRDPQVLPDVHVQLPAPGGSRERVPVSTA